MVYYNENDRKKAAWLRRLIELGAIAPGDVDERSIVDVRGADLSGYMQCHWFAGIGIWSYALRLAGWSDDRPVWTASCPCQPFSAAGKRKGKEDARHLWPEFARLIRECKPVVAIGEQVSGKNGRAWIDYVFDDLEANAYTVGAVDSPACGYGAPHIRNRMYWVAVTDCERLDWERVSVLAGRSQQADSEIVRDCAVERLADATGKGLSKRGSRAGEPSRSYQQSERFCTANGLGESSGARLEGRQSELRDDGAERAAAERAGAVGIVGDSESLGRGRGANDEDRRRRECAPTDRGPVNGAWRDAAWIPCKDGKWRAIEAMAAKSESSAVADEHSAALGYCRDEFGVLYGLPLQHKAPSRVLRLKGYGDAIVSSQARYFIETVMEEIK